MVIFAALGFEPRFIQNQHIFDLGIDSLTTLKTTNITSFNIQEIRQEANSFCCSEGLDDLTLNGHYLSEETHPKSTDLIHYNQKSLLYGKRSSHRAHKEKKGLFKRGIFSFVLCCVEYSNERKPFTKEINLKN